MMAKEKGLMDFSVAHTVDTGEGTKSVPRVAARVVFLLKRRGLEGIARPMPILV